MYPIDERDVVVELNDVPKPRGGAPMPLVLADDVILVLSYFLQEASAVEASESGCRDSGLSRAVNASAWATERRSH